MDAREIRKELVPEIKELLAYVAVGYPVRELGAELERLSAYFQALGIAYLLENADRERFRENLVWSAHSRRYFLRKSRDESNYEDRHHALGRTEAFFDALAAGHLGLAREIADLSIETWRADWEYEDDFCYYLFWHGVVRGGSTAGQVGLRDILTKFKKALEGGDSPRLDACKAVLEGNNAEFRAALSALMEERNKEMESARERNLELDPAAAVCWARGFVSIEGLALLRVAEVRGMMAVEPGEELQLCPGLAMLSVDKRESLDMFTRIELARSR
jgi:hypothetical protein